jgi:fumarate reductase flavoprotein subunit
VPSNEPVVVIGAGLAGACCAAELARAGVETVLLESEPVPGGSTRWAVGSLSAAGTRWQRAAGIEDSADAHFADLLAMCEVPDPGYEPSLRRMCTEGAATLDWLAELGVEFAGPFLEPPHGRARMHNAVPDASVLVDAVLSTTKVELCTGRRVTDIRRQGNGFLVTSVKGAVSAGAVVVASGDLSAADPQVPGVNPASTALPIAALIRRLQAWADPPRSAPGLRLVTPGGPWVAPADELVAAATVVDRGQRVPGRTLLAQPSAFAGRELYLELAEADLPDPDRLGTYPSVGYGDLRRFEVDGLVSRSGGTLRIGPSRVVVTLADGALRVDGDLRVRARDGAPIEGIYAVGSAALGPTQLAGHGHHLLWAAVTGRWAAQAVERIYATARSST